jgi:hypothetical protein
VLFITTAVRTSNPTSNRFFNSILKKEAAHSSEALVMIYQTIWYHIPEDSNLQSSRCENLKYVMEQIPATTR